MNFFVMVNKVVNKYYDLVFPKTILFTTIS